MWFQQVLDEIKILKYYLKINYACGVEMDVQEVFINSINDNS